MLDHVVVCLFASYLSEHLIKLSQFVLQYVQMLHNLFHGKLTAGKAKIVPYFYFKDSL